MKGTLRESEYTSSTERSPSRKRERNWERCRERGGRGGGFYLTTLLIGETGLLKKPKRDIQADFRVTGYDDVHWLWVVPSGGFWH